jgi:hypothetical protein
MRIYLTAEITWWNLRGKRKIRKTDLGPLSGYSINPDNTVTLYPFGYEMPKPRENPAPVHLDLVRGKLDGERKLKETWTLKRGRRVREL